MVKKYFAKIIANDLEGLQIVSAYCAGARVNIKNIKYLKNNKIFLIYLERLRIEIENKEQKVNSICKFEYIESVKSKNVRQNDNESALNLKAIDVLKNKKNYEINLIFDKNIFITLAAEVIEVTLEDQNEVVR